MRRRRAPLAEDLTDCGRDDCWGGPRDENGSLTADVSELKDVFLLIDL